MHVLVVSGTGTEIGKTVVTAGLTALARDRGEHVAVVKPAQTGVDEGEAGDLDTVRRLSGATDLHEHVRFPDPLSPAAAARHASVAPADLEASATRIRELTTERDLVLVEGAGGLLVRYDQQGGTIADLAVELAAPVLVVTASGLGTLNVTALTVEALAARRLELAGLVIGCWPAEPDLADRSNLDDLAELAGGPLAGVLPEGAGELAPADFRAAARAGLTDIFGGNGSIRTSEQVPGPTDRPHHLRRAR